MFYDTDIRNELLLRELRELTARMLKASGDGEFERAAAMRARRHGCLRQLASTGKRLSSAA